jgi:hypothetical protein
MKKKSLITLVAYLFLIVSTYFLMSNPEQMGIQMGFGMFYGIYLMFEIWARIRYIKSKIRKNTVIDKMYDDIKFLGSKIRYVFTLYSGFIIALAVIGITHIFFSSMWLILLIFTFQSLSFYILAYGLKNDWNETKLLLSFFASYAFLSMLFGWTSAHIAKDMIMLPPREDLFIAFYGVLIFPIVSLIYFDDKYNYKKSLLSKINFFKKTS